MSAFSILALLLLGVIIILVEFFFVPGTTVVGFIGFVLSLIAIYFAYRDLGSLYGSVLLGGSILFLAVAMYISIKKETWKMFALNENIEGKLKKHTVNVQVGDEGVTLSSLKPSGEARFGDQMLEVHSQGGFVDVNSKISIILVEDNKIYVKPI